MTEIPVVLQVCYVSLLILHLAQSVVLHVRGRKDAKAPTRDTKSTARSLSIATQVALFTLALYLAYRGGILSRDLFSPGFIVLGLAAGHLIFGVSLFVTHRSLSDTSSHFLNVRALGPFLAEHPYVLSRFIMVAISEEIVWRAAAQSMAVSTLGVVAGVGVIAVGFAVAHDHFFRNSALVAVEFMCFALLIGALYHWSGSLIFVMTIHAVRDIEIAYLEYCVRVHDLGDERSADRELEAHYMRGIRTTHE